MAAKTRIETPLLRRNIFINCPFDPGYKDILDALVFTVIDLRFVARCALETDDAGEIRVHKIQRMIEECPFAIHDISHVALDASTGLPRFNMPFELGLFLGCKRYGAEGQRSKKCMILDREKHRYQKFLSDIAGQDIRSHGGDPRQAIVETRDWLTTAARMKRTVGGAEIAARYALFQAELPNLCLKMKRDLRGLTYSDRTEMIEDWVEMHR